MGKEAYWRKQRYVSSSSIQLKKEDNSPRQTEETHNEMPTGQKKQTTEKSICNQAPIASFSSTTTFSLHLP